MAKIKVTTIIVILFMCSTFTVSAQGFLSVFKQNLSKIGMRQKAENGDVDAQVKYGLMCYEDSDYISAIKYWQMASDKGSSEADLSIGLCNFYGDCGPRLPILNTSIVGAANRGNVIALRILQHCYENGYGVERNLKTAQMFREAADKIDSTSRETTYADKAAVCMMEGKKTGAVYWYKLGSMEGIASMQDALGTCFFNGTGVKRDYEMAIELIRRAANQGYPLAQYHLGQYYYYRQNLLFRYSTNLKHNYEEAFKWLSLSVKDKNAPAGAMLLIAKCYANGRGTNIDHELAEYWMKKAADAHDESAEYTLQISEH